MSRKRKCRYTPEELALHKEAVRLRNMTDKQLVEEFHRTAAARPTRMALRRDLRKNGARTSSEMRSRAPKLKGGLDPWRLAPETGLQS